MPRARYWLAALAASLLLPASAAGQSPTPTPVPTPVPTATPAPAPAPPVERRIAAGVTAGGIDVSNLTLPEASARLQQTAGPALRRTVTVRIGGHTMRLTMRSLKLSFDADRTARRAYQAGVAATPGVPVDVPLAVAFRRVPIREFVERVDKRVHIAPRDAFIRITLRRILKRPSRPGRDLDARALRAAIEATVISPTAERVLRPGRKEVRAKVGLADLPRRHKTILTVDRRNFKLRLFKRLKVAKTYGIAVGAAGYDTPTGLYSITNKAVNPAWSAPDRPWAGLYRGQTVPGGAPNNPLKARWLGIVNGVGIHGTGDPGSIGSRASHGCIRMRVPDVIDLYPRVPVGTPVLIR
jgi:lipoprotein-anchoring transpeptidase ErfK/SrfK